MARRKAAKSRTPRAKDAQGDPSDKVNTAGSRASGGKASSGERSGGKAAGSNRKLAGRRTAAKQKTARKATGNTRKKSAPVAKEKTTKAGAARKAAAKTTRTRAQRKPTAEPPARDETDHRGSGGEVGLLGQGPGWWGSSLDARRPPSRVAPEFRRGETAPGEPARIEFAPIDPATAAPQTGPSGLDPGDLDLGDLDLGDLDPVDLAAGVDLSLDPLGADLAAELDAILSGAAPEPGAPATPPPSQAVSELLGDPGDVARAWSPAAEPPASAPTADDRLDEELDALKSELSLDDVERGWSDEAAIGDFGPPAAADDASAIDGVPALDAASDAREASIDDRVAANVDDLLQGDFESIDALLDEPARQAPASAGEGVIEPADFIPGMRGLPAEPLPTAPPPAEQSAASRPAAASTPAPEPASAPAAPTAKAEPKPAAGLVHMLERLNYPLRGLSPSARTIVDWIALSLVVWVPIVWLIALLVVGH